MPATTHDLDHLVALIEAARAEADRLGAGAGAVLAHLDAASAAARAQPVAGGTPDEGLRPEDLNTGNDQ